MLNSIKKFFDFCNKEDRKKFYLSIIFGVCKAFLSALRISAISVILRDAIEQNISLRTAWITLVIMVISIIGQAIVLMISTTLQAEAGYHTSAMKRIEIAEHLRYLPMGYFNENSLGEITSVATNTMESISDVATRSIMIISQGLLSTVLIVLFVFYFDYRIGMILVIGIILWACMNVYMQKVNQRTAPIMLNSTARLVSTVLAYLQGIVEVKNYNITDKSLTKLDDAINGQADIMTRIELDVVPLTAIHDLLLKLTGVLVIVASLYFYTQGTMDLFITVMMCICSFMVFEGLEMTGHFAALLRFIDTSVSRVNDIMNVPSMDITGDKVTSDTAIIELENIKFSYDTKQIINDITLLIPEKSKVAFIGPSGSGKTTLCNLIARFWDVNSGNVKFGGHNVKEYDYDDLIQNFSFVFQRVYLFEDTVANNIRFGNLEATMEEVEEAAKQARCHEFIMQLPQGYDTVLHEGGSSLSGGEKQRISIARAMLKKSKVVILDEATANIDPENEKELMEAIQALTKDKTVIMIAHRLKTIRNVDQIYVIDQGKIVESGKHEELLRENGIYKKFIDARAKVLNWHL